MVTRVSVQAPAELSANRLHDLSSEASDRDAIYDVPALVSAGRPDVHTPTPRHHPFCAKWPLVRLWTIVLVGEPSGEAFQTVVFVGSVS
jgi:hypothetical protein